MDRHKQYLSHNAIDLLHIPSSRNGADKHNSTGASALYADTIFKMFNISFSKFNFHCPSGTLLNIFRRFMPAHNLFLPLPSCLCLFCHWRKEYAINLLQWQSVTKHSLCSDLIDEWDFITVFLSMPFYLFLTPNVFFTHNVCICPMITQIEWSEFDLFIEYNDYLLIINYLQFDYKWFHPTLPNFSLQYIVLR